MLESPIDLIEHFEELRFAVEKLGAGLFPKTVEAVEAATVHVQRAWKDEAARHFAFSTGKYIQNVRVEFGVAGNPYHGRVFNELPYADYLEDGYPAFDMKNMLHTSHKIRISKKGKRYMIIPFRHGTPARQGEAGRAGNRATMWSMPEHVYDPAKRLVMSQIKTKFAERSVQDLNLIPQKGYVAARRTYEWGERLTKQALESVGASRAEIQKYSGMVRVPREEARTSGSQYLTFRVMTEDSKGWIHPAQPPLRIKERAENKSAAVVRRIIEEGFERDIQKIKDIIK